MIQAINALRGPGKNLPVRNSPAGETGCPTCLRPADAGRADFAPAAG
jgi:hypothetical protein